MYFFSFPSGALFDLFFITEGAQFACFSPSLKRGNLGVFVLFLKKGRIVPVIFLLYREGRNLHMCISLAEGAPPGFFFFTEGAKFVFLFPHFPEASAIFYFFLLCFSFLVYLSLLCLIMDFPLILNLKRPDFTYILCILTI